MSGTYLQELAKKSSEIYTILEPYSKEDRAQIMRMVDYSIHLSSAIEKDKNKDST